MSYNLKPLDQQRVVITGASSGIGLETARRFAEAGARVLLVSRNAEALETAVEEIRAAGGKAEHAVADVGDQQAVEGVARRAAELFGGIDTWVNDAGTSTYGEAAEVPIEEQRQVFETNYWGTVHGSLAAVARMGEGGALINVGSVLSDMPTPLMAAYVASKHAVKGFTDSLRLELMHDKSPIAVTLIKPSAINTPFKEHGRNHMGVAAALPPPIYEPAVVAKAILHCAHKPTRELTIGGGGKLQTIGFQLAPGLADKVFSKIGERLLQKPGQPPQAGDNLFSAGEDGDARSDAPLPMPFSAYTAVRTHAGWIVGFGVALGVLVAGAMAADRYSDDVRRHARRVARDLQREGRPYYRRYVRPALARFR